MDDVHMEANVHRQSNGEENKKNFTHVRALHNFRCSNNDELYLKKDDIITITQTPSGGWWEGTLDGITGWFPANYVVPILPGDPIYETTVAFGGSNLTITSEISGGSGPHSGQFNNDPVSLTSIDGLNGENSTEYRAIVIKDIEDSENAFINSLQDAINLYLKPMYQYKIFPSDSEINAVLRSITEICSVHRRFLTLIDKNKSSSPKDNRMGGLFMQFAPQFKHAHFEYCSHHARFVHLIEKFKKEICTFFASYPTPPTTSNVYPSSPSMAAPSSLPNVLITSSLSVSFRRLDKYPALLQELQRYTEESHIDRGDTQRAGFLYREIAMSCLELRRRKEMELEVMLGNIRNFDGLKIETYGNIQRMEPVSILILPPWSEPKKDCYLVLFPKVLMVLSVGNEMTSFSYESMLQLENARVPVINFNDTQKPDGYSYRLEIQGNSAHPLSDSELILTYMVQFNEESVWREWYQLLQKHVRLLSAASMVDLPPLPSTILGSSSSSSLTTTTPPNGSSSSISSPQSSSSNSMPLVTKPPIVVGSKPPHPPTPPPPPPIPPLPQHRKTPNGLQSPLKRSQSFQSNQILLPRRGSFWSDRILTPHAPYRPESANSNLETLDQNEDIQLLNVIDSYYRKFPGINQSTKDGVNSRVARKLSNTNLPELELEHEGQRQMLVEIFEAAGSNNNRQHNRYLGAGRNSGSEKSSLQSLANKLNQMSLSNSSLDRSILGEIYEQLRQMRSEMTHLNESFKEERRQRKRLQDALFHKGV
ncbi:hypothetical protein RDWZM_008371 [Blomia tropicalis]|uniref:Rho guanine nucleotide exchange factor 7 n=1 Tax=Blomia tropicalis TaxID=40697 RepID=A0A9Q0M196_BLOTA|nr:hypothetical protein RDWZM_008371 [Blomia tropicalis]